MVTMSPTARLAMTTAMTTAVTTGSSRSVVARSPAPARAARRPPFLVVVSSWVMTLNWGSPWVRASISASRRGGSLVGAPLEQVGGFAGAAVVEVRGGHQAGGLRHLGCVGADGVFVVEQQLEADAAAARGGGDVVGEHRQHLEQGLHGGLALVGDVGAGGKAVDDADGRVGGGRQQLAEGGGGRRPVGEQLLGVAVGLHQLLGHQ